MLPLKVDEKVLDLLPLILLEVGILLCVHRPGQELHYISLPNVLEVRTETPTGEEVLHSNCVFGGVYFL